MRLSEKQLSVSRDTATETGESVLLWRLGQRLLSPLLTGQVKMFRAKQKVTLSFLAEVRIQDSGSSRTQCWFCERPSPGPPEPQGRGLSDTVLGEGRGAPWASGILDPFPSFACDSLWDRGGNNTGFYPRHWKAVSTPSLTLPPEVSHFFPPFGNSLCEVQIQRSDFMGIQENF